MSENGKERTLPIRELRGMQIDVARCDEILDQGAQLEYRPEPGIIDKTFARKGK